MSIAKTNQDLKSFTDGDWIAITLIDGRVVKGKFNGTLKRPIRDPKTKQRKPEDCVAIIVDGARMTFQLTDIEKAEGCEEPSDDCTACEDGGQDAQEREGTQDDQEEQA